MVTRYYEPDPRCIDFQGKIFVLTILRSFFCDIFSSRFFPRFLVLWISIFPLIGLQFRPDLIKGKSF